MDRNFVEAYRLYLFGRMAQGVSHEIDNHLSIVIGYSEMVRINASNPDKVRENAGKVLLAGERIADLIRQYSHYVRPHEPENEFFSVEQTLREIMLFARYDLERNGAIIETPVSYPPGMICCDRRDFALALLVLLFNAAEALPRKGGMVSIGVSRDEEAWEIAVTDNGAGIPEGMEEKVFEQGFSLRPESFRSGMGLPTARYIVAEAGGVLRFSNIRGGGCAAVIRLPVAQGKADGPRE